MLESPHALSTQQSTKKNWFARRGAAGILIATLIAGAQVPLATAAHAADPIAGGLSAGDSLFPRQGNTGYDALHYDINLTVNVAVSTTANQNATTTFPAATATITAATTGAPLSSYAFDFQGSASNLAASTLNVDSVTVNGVPATFSRIENTSTSDATLDEHKLIVTPATPVEGEFVTVVNYSGRPVPHRDTDGSNEGWNVTLDGATFVNQPVGSMTAYPNNNTPRDKATYTFTINAPSKLTTSATAVSANPGLKDAAVVSNGELISRTPSSDGSRTTWVWNQTKPMASELSLISIGRYDMYESTITLESGTVLPEWSFIDPSISAQNQLTSLSSRAQLGAILSYLETKFGPYPGKSTGIVVDVAAGINYALETQDRSFFPTSASRSTTIHELMHQWWGDAVSPVDWNDIWLNEGPATYSTELVGYEGAGSATNSTETTYFNAWNSSSPTNAIWTVPTAGMTQASQLYGNQVYARGAWTLEALKTAIGSASFNQVMSEWQSRYTGTSKRTSDFIALAEEISGRSLTAFFQPWLYGTTKAPWPAKFNLTLSGPVAPINEGDTATYTLSSRNTGKVVQNSSVVEVDLAGVLDKATIGSLPAGTALNGTILTWTVPSTAVGATSTVSFDATVSAGTTGATLSASARASTLGSTCVSCSPSIVIGAQPVSPSAVPTIVGTPTVGQPLAAQTDGWAEGTTFAYQWLVDGTPVPGATSASYTPDFATVGLAVTVRVTGSNGALAPVTTTSAASAAVVRATLTAPIPTISGTPQFGKKLTVDTSGWDPGTFFSYQWATNGVNVTAGNGGTGPTFVPAVATQLGQTVTVTVTGTKAGATTASRTSVATAPIAAGEFVLTPTPTIGGTLKALSPLSAIPGQWDDGTSFTYVWSADGTPIPSATAATYTPTLAQIGSAISVTVTGAKAGYPSTPKTSATVTITPAAQVLTPTPTITGTKVATEFTGVPGTWDSGASQTYRWLANDIAIEGETGTSFTPGPAFLGQQITFEVTSTRASYETVVRTSLPTVVAAGDLTLTPTPTIAGTPQVGEELTATVGDWDADVDLSYQWLADGAPIADATTETLTLGAAQAGAEITFAVTGTKVGYATVTKTSEPTAEVALAEFDPTTVPTISGTPKVGVVLTAVPGEWDAAASLSYQWFADDEPIEGAIAAEYTPGPSRVGAILTVEVTGTQDGYETVSLTSDPTAAVLVGDLVTTPDPTISGTPKVGVLLTALPGTWDVDTALTYQWLSNGTPIGSATASEFIPTPAELGTTLTVAVTGTKAGYAPVTKTSAASAAVVAGDFALAPVPTITGTPRVGVTLTAVPGTWDSGTALTYQWLADGAPIGGAVSATFTPGPSQVGAAITVSVTGTKTGYATLTKTSDATAAVALAVIAATPTPVITGVVKVGSELTAVPGTWTSGVSLAYQWFANGEPIEGATGTKFTPDGTKRGDILTVSVTATKPGHVTVLKTSKPTRPVAAGTLGSAVPTISGTVQVGVLLTAVPGAWDPGTVFSYQWSSNGVAIAGATGPTYTPDVTKAGKTLRLTVTGSKTGYSSITRTSTGVIVAGAPLTLTPTPTIAGQVGIGRVLTARPGTWDSGVTLTYQWKKDGVPILGAKSSTYRLRPSDVGTITVTVTGSKLGYASVSKTSAGTVFAR